MTVFLVGAGPGDPGLITVKGARVLADADVVIFDRLGTQHLLALVNSEAELVDVGKNPDGPSPDQDQINQLLVEFGQKSECVVRLKGGDPFVYGRGAEEILALKRARLEFEVIPGISSAVAAPAYGGVPVTHRGLSSSFTVVTGHENPARPETQIDWANLAKLQGTLVVLMGASRIGIICKALLEAGKPPNTPLAVIHSGTTPNQKTVRGTLANAHELEIDSPAAIVIGAVASLDLSWFESKPLFGKRIVVTRAKEQAGQLSQRLVELGRTGH